MFTGLVEKMAILSARSPDAGGQRLTLTHDFPDLSLGESISVSGACLTVVAFDEETFAVQASPETLTLTTLGLFAPGSRVNLERALPAGARLGGHLVTGHVDGMGTVRAVEPVQDMTQLQIAVPRELSKYMAKKGSVTVDGVSLTINDVAKDVISLLIIPHTRQVTTLGALAPEASVNLEVDLVARYVERLLSDGAATDGDRSLGGRSDGGRLDSD